MPLFNEALAQMPEVAPPITAAEKAEDAEQGIPDSQLRDIGQAAHFAYDLEVRGKEEFQKGAAKKVCTVFVPRLLKEIDRLKAAIMEGPHEQPGRQQVSPDVPAPKRTRGRPRKVQAGSQPVKAGAGTVPPQV